MRPTTRYVDSFGYSIACQVLGEGPFDLFFVPGLMSHLDLQWCDPLFAGFLYQLASSSRLIIMDQRGIGLSDTSATVPSIDERAADIGAVAEAVGADNMIVIGHCHGGPPAIVYAAAHPERVAGLVLMSTFANGTRDINRPGALSDEDLAAWMMAVEHWGEGRSIAYFNPSRDEGRLYRNLYATFERSAMTKGMARAAVASTRQIDVTAALDSIRVPTLVLHCSDDFLPVESGKVMAAAIPGARFVELDGADHAPFAGVGSQEVAAHILEFIGKCDAMPIAPAQRFGAILMTDIVASTEAASKVGDAEWADMLMRHDAAVHDDIDQHHGVCVKFTGDGYLATFTSCEAALRCAAALQQTASDFDLAIRCGVHAGAYAPAGQDVVGLTVVIASRLMSAAQDSTILASDAVSRAVAGGGFQFGAPRSFTLKGIAEPVRAAELKVSVDQPNSVNRWLPDPTVIGPRVTRVDRLLVAGARRLPRAAHLLAKAKWQRA